MNRWNERNTESDGPHCHRMINFHQDGNYPSFWFWLEFEANSFRTITWKEATDENGEFECKIRTNKCAKCLPLENLFKSIGMHLILHTICATHTHMIDHLKRLTLYFCFLDILYKYKRKQKIAHKQIQWNKNYSATLRSWILSNFYDFGNYNFANHLQVIAQHWRATEFLRLATIPCHVFCLISMFAHKNMQTQNIKILLCMRASVCAPVTKKSTTSDKNALAWNFFLSEPNEFRPLKIIRTELAWKSTIHTSTDLNLKLLFCSLIRAARTHTHSISCNWIFIRKHAYTLRCFRLQ